MARWDCKKEVVPFTAMALTECATVTLHTLFKAAHLKGLNNLVFLTYAYALGTLVLLPLSSVFSRRGLTSSLKLPLLYRIALLSLMGFMARMLSYKGLEYSSPALASAISTLQPGFTFILAVFFRMENVDWSRSSTQAKVIGTIVSVSGALVAVLYKGPTLLSTQSGSVLSQSPLLSKSNWALGGLLFTTDQLLNSGTHILQTQILKMHPDELVVAFMYILGVTLITIPVGFISERELSSWRPWPSITLTTITYSAFFGPIFITTIHAYCLPSKGPLYVSIFKPISIVIAAAASVVFLGDDLHLGSVVGAIILLLGFYAVIWGKAKEQKGMDFGSENLRASPDAETPLLQSHTGKYVE